MLTEWFPIGILSEDLQPDDSVYREMLSYVHRFHDRKGSITGDVVNEKDLFLEDEFQWLNGQVSLHTKRYLDMYGSSGDVYVQKAWPVTSNRVYRHDHKNAHISAVYYLQSPDNDSGDLRIHIPESHPFKRLPINPDRYTHLSYDVATYKPNTNLLIIFPSSLQHEVEQYTGTAGRYSITYDLIIAATDKDNEMCMSKPSKWRKL